jgi:hypothetical protein
LWCSSFGIAYTSFWVYSRHNNFPDTYHPSEPSKGRQLLESPSTWNFRHPLLLMESGNVALRFFDEPGSVREALLIGRRVSAVFAAMAVVALALAGCLGLGGRGLWVCGAAMAMCPPLLVHAHFFKEDSALILGMAVVVLGVRWVLGATTALRATAGFVVLAMGCGLATSGKFVGAVFVLPAILAVCLMPARRWFFVPLRIILLLLIGATVFVVINARAFDRLFPPRVAPFAREQMTADAETGITASDNDVRLRIPNTYCLRVAASDVTAPVWGVLIAGMTWSVVRRKVSRWGINLAAIVIAPAVLLCFSPVPYPRYALPISVILYFVAALFLSRFVAWIGGKGRPIQIGGTIAVAVVLIHLGARCYDFTQQFGDDSRQRLREWVAQLPADTRIVADKYTCLGDEGDHWRYPNQKPIGHVRLILRKYAGDAADSLQAMANSGVEYVAITESAYGPFFEVEQAELAVGEDVRKRRAKFYADIIARGELCWQRKAEHPTHSTTNPEIRVYRITGLARRAM